MIVIKKIITGVVLASLILFSQGMNAEAAVSQYFGGRGVGLIPCTGSGSTVQSLTIFFPLYLNSGVPAGGWLGTPYAITYPSYNVRPGSWVLGTYQSGAAVCIIGVCPYCVYIPNLGLILPFTATSAI